MRLIDILWCNRITDFKEILSMIKDISNLFKEIKKSTLKKKDDLFKNL